MGATGISTQEELTGFKNELELLASNLNYHVNSSLSTGHGIDLVYGFQDSDGHDRRTYQDSYGEIISGSDPTKPNFIRFMVNGVPYYAPCLYNPSPDPGPQPAGTGSIVLTPQSSAVGASSLITDYVSDQAVAAESIDASLLGHTLLAHQTAHFPVAITNVQTFAPSGAVLANYLASFTFGGQVYQIPCDTRLGGPVQASAQLGSMALLVDYTTHRDPGDTVPQTLTGVPSRVYQVTFKVRGFMEVYPWWMRCPPHNTKGTIIPVSLVGSTSPSPVGVVSYTGTDITSSTQAFPPGSYVVNTGTTYNQTTLIIRNSLGTIYQFLLLNTAVSPSGATGGCHLCDYTFTVPMTTGDTATLIYRTLDGSTSTNGAKTLISDSNPPWSSVITPYLGTRYTFVQVDPIAIV